MISEAAAVLTQGYETKDLTLPSQVFFSKPGKGVDHKNQAEKPPSNVKIEREIEKKL
jgi:hypothetical protein